MCVIVVTPSLNKSFKFQSDWPYNNSQIYLLQPIIRDLKNDDKRIFEETKDGYIFTVKVTYDNDKKLVKQKIYLDKDLNLTKVEVLDNKDNVKMRFNILEYNLKENFDNDYFELSDEYEDNSKEDKKEVNVKDNNQEDKKSENVKDNNQEDNTNNNDSNQQTNNENNKQEQPQSKIEDIVYPMYLPLNTYLSNQDTVSTEAGERVIMTFSGDTPFLLVQETAKMNNTTDFVNGDPYLILDTIGAVTDYSVSWINNGVEYNVVSDSMNIDELISVAQSISPKAIGK